MRYWFILLFIWHSSAMAIDLPDMGTSASTVMSLEEEKKIGEEFFQEFKKQASVAEDVEINQYINYLGNKLVAYSDSPAQNFHFFVVNEPSINAFAVPGGYIGVHSGLIFTTHTEGELASVLAHEIAHVTQRHIARTIEGTTSSLPLLVATAVAAFLLGGSNPDVAQAAVAAVAAGGIQIQLNFTRAHEKEADRIGMQLLANSGFDPRHMPGFFERMHEATRFGGGKNIPELLRSHPVTINRIAESRDRAEKYQHSVIEDEVLYHLMKAKLLVELEHNHPKLIKKLQLLLKEGRYRDERAMRYALVLANLESNQTADVQSQLKWLIENDTDRTTYRVLQAKLAWLNKDSAKTMQIYEEALKIYPGDQLLTLNYAHYLLQNKQIKKAKSLLAIMPKFRHIHPEYYHLLAKTNQQLGSPAEFHLAMAEYHYLQGELGLAVEQLEQARKLKAVDFYLASRIEARFKQLKQKLHERENPDKSDQRK